MTDSSSRYNVTITVDRDGGDYLNPAVFAVAAERAASARTASVMSAHTAEKIISIVTVQAVDRPAAIALAVVSVRRPAALPNR